MLEYMLHYAKGESPDERRKAMFTAGSMEQPGEYGRLHNEANVRKVTMILERTVGALNELLHPMDGMPKMSSFRYQNQIAWFDTINRLLKVIIPRLEELDKGIKPSKEVNQAIILALKKLQANDRVTPFAVMKILAQFEVPGLKQIEFKNTDEAQNIETLADLGYPLDRVSDEYNCAVLMTVMSDPCQATPTEYVDRSVIEKTPRNPFNREAWAHNIPTDAARLQDIKVFMKKVEWVYSAYYTDERYKHLYHDETLQGWLQDKDVSYEDFCLQVTSHVDGMTDSNQFVFFTPEKERDNKHVVFPAKYILDLFSKHQIHTLKPSAEDYEKLVRRMAAAGYDRGLEQLLSSSVLDIVKIDVHAQNNQGKHALDFIASYQEKYPALQENYARCGELIVNYQALPEVPDAGCAIA